MERRSHVIRHLLPAPITIWVPSSVTLCHLQTDLSLSGDSSPLLNHAHLRALYHSYNNAQDPVILFLFSLVLVLINCLRRSSRLSHWGFHMLILCGKISSHSTRWKTRKEPQGVQNSFLSNVKYMVNPRPKTFKTYVFIPTFATYPKQPSRRR